MNLQTASDAPTACYAWWRERELWLLMAVVSLVYFSRLTTLPICGEESRWASGASEMIATGDWIVPRQQGQVFPERPPLGSWTMALVALAWGRMDAVAVRLPSVLAMLAASLLVYGYGRTFLSRLGALGAAAAFASFGQVLVLGRLGESEALFTCLLAGALLVWHWGYLCGWRPATTWIAGYFLTALAALDKGPQAPMYMVTATVVFLALRQDWRYLLSWSHAAGLMVFAIVVGAWQIPFYFATDWETVTDIWSGLARDRFSLEGLARHVASYPVETLGCLLPWSPLLAAYLFPSFRRTLGGCRPQLAFLVTALAVTYPSVWFSAGARGRYFMPLYPCVALLIGVVVERWAGGAPGSAERRAWRWFLRCLGLTAAGGSFVLLVASATNWFPKLAGARQPLWFSLFFCAATVANAWLLWHHTRNTAAYYSRPWLQRTASFGHSMTPAAVLLWLVVFLGMSYVGPIMNTRLNRSNDLGPPLAGLRESLPEGARLVSFGPIAHRFAYYYGEPITELAWPVADTKLPDGVNYFCFDMHKGDNLKKRLSGRGRKWIDTPGTLPFEWEPVGVFPCDPTRHKSVDTTVVVGRIIPRDELNGGIASSERADNEIAAGKMPGTSAQ